MSRTSTFHLAMSRLSLVAILLMAFAPATSRWVASGSLQFLPGLTALCTSSGLKSVDASALGGDAAKVPAPDHFGMGADCAYCPLLAATALLLLTVALLVPCLPANPGRPSSPRLFRLASSFPGLGSRGPPRLA